ncbi:MAG: hypothetical protein HUJ73_08180 [Eubacterium sp.]|nr:hypothetical protein [Eubacterium sp.]
MKKLKRTRLIKLLAVVVAVVFLFGCQMTVFAAGTSDLVGGGTKGGVSSTTTKTQTYNGTTTTNKTTATTSKVTTKVNTGVMDKMIPFIAVMSAAFVAFAAFFHLKMNQIRYGKSEKYHKELLDFKCACKE